MSTGQRPTAGQYLISVLSSFFGVQSDKNRQRDFTQGDPVIYIFGGIVFTMSFVLLILLVVHLVIL